MDYPINRISSSMVNLYLDCPRLFYFHHIAKIHLPQKQQHLLFGSAVHKGIEVMYNKDADPYAEFDRMLDKDKLLDEEKAEHPRLLALGHEMLKNYMEYHPKLVKLYGLDDGVSEKYVRRFLINPITGQQSTLQFSGVLDRLTKGGRILDYKTSAGKWKDDAAGSKVQTLLYNLWYYSEYNEVAEETLYCILIKKFKKHKHDQVIQMVSANVSLEDMAAAFDEVEIIVEKIRQGMFDCDGRCGFFAKQELARMEEALALQEN